MQSAQLGKTDLRVSRICFGCWQLSPTFWGNVPLEEWTAALRRASELGINFLDTADAYGDGFAESTLGEFFAREGGRDRWIVATKFYWNIEAKDRFPDTRPAYILRACEASLKRLRTDRIDLYQIHSWDALIRPDDVAEAFAQLRQQGKIRWIGVSNWNADEIRMGLKYFGIECLQPQYNLLEREIEHRELPVCLEHRLGVMAYSPLYRGLLTGKYAPDHKFSDHRDNTGLFHGKAYQRVQQGLDQLQPIADRHGLTLPQLAIRWVLTHPALTSAIVGVKKPEHIETIVKAADAALPPEDWHKAGDVIARAKREALAVTN